MASKTMPGNTWVSAFGAERVRQLRDAGREGTADCLTSVIRRWEHDVGDTDMTEISGMTLDKWIGKMRMAGLAPNTIDFYFRGFRSLYHRARFEGLFTDTLRPFEKVRTRPEKTRKRALPVKALRMLAKAEFEDGADARARDIFMLSFYLRGIAPVDLWKLRKRDAVKGRLTYRRSKTRQKLEIRLEDEARRLVRRLRNQGEGGNLLSLPSAESVNRRLKKIGRRLGISFPLTLYCARHTWATTAQRCNVPLSVISRSLGHDKEETTRIYLAGLETGVIDSANRRIIRSVLK